MMMMMSFAYLASFTLHLNFFQLAVQFRKIALLRIKHKVATGAELSKTVMRHSQHVGRLHGLVGFLLIVTETTTTLIDQGRGAIGM